MRLLYLSCGLAVLFSQPTLAQTLSPPALTGAFRVAERSAPPEEGPLTLARAIRLAIQYNPELSAASREVDVTEAGMIQARARPNPELALLSEGLRQDNRTTTVQLNQPIELGGKRAARISLAQREQELAVADLATRRADVRAGVIAAYFEALTAQERLELAHASQQVAQAASGAASRRVLAGKISPVDETRAKVAEAGARVERVQASSAQALAQRRLASMWGAAEIPSGKLATPANVDVAMPSLPELMSHLDSAPQTRRARLQVDRQQAQVAVERARQVPDITFSLGRKRDSTQESRSQTVVGLSVPLPLFDRNQGNLLSALRRTDKARDELVAEQSRLRMTLSESYLRVESARAELLALRGEILPGAQSAFDAAAKRFELGKFSFLDVLDAQRTLFQAKAQYFRALSDYYRAIADIERIVGAEQAFLHFPAPTESQ